MLALRLERNGKGGAGDPRGGPPTAFRGKLVLPKWLRRPARLLQRLNDGDFEAPRFSATLLTGAFLAATGVYGAYVGGHMPAYAQAVTARTGFAVDEVRVVGHRQTSEIDILDRLELDGWTSLIGFDAAAARNRVAQLPWVETASVRKVYPDEIEVQIQEREPFAIWQHGNDLAIVQKDGRVITPFSGGSLGTLPQVIGLGAMEDAQVFLSKIAEYPQLASKVRAYVRVAERRWDLRLANGITVKLPENGEIEAVSRLAALDSESRLLSRDIATLDMRIGDRLVMQLTSEGMKQRTADLAAEAKARKKAGNRT